jgi:CHASE2 domain-containing sensor protein
MVFIDLIKAIAIAGILCLLLALLLVAWVILVPTVIFVFIVVIVYTVMEYERENKEKRPPKE